MYCKNCNKTYSKNDRFCTVCGQMLEEKKPTYTQAVSSAALVYKHGSSKLYLAFAILMVVSALVNLVMLNVQNFQLFRNIKDAGGMLDSDLPILFFIQIAGTCIQIAFWIEALAIWLHYRACRRAEPSASGLQMLKVVNICQAIGAPLLSVLFLIVMFGAMLSYIGDAYDMVAVIIILVLLAFILLPILVCMEINYFKIISATDKAKKMLNGDKLYKMPLYYILFNFIVAAFGLIVTPISVFAFDGGLWSLITLLPSSAAAVLPAVLMLRFNADVKKCEAAPAPQASEAPMSPSEAAAAILMQDADEIIETQMDNEETIEDMPQA